MSRPVFTVDERDRVRDRLLEMARADARVVAGATVGSLAVGGGDRWSDLDLTFGLTPGATPADLLAAWTPRLEQEFGAVPLFDLPFQSSLYRVFLLPGHLQVDLSFTPGAEFGALGPNFTLLFGEAAPRTHLPAPSATTLFGLGAHHAVRARFCLERGRAWQAEYWISGVRDQALSLACLRRGLEPRNGRGYDDLPAEVTTRFDAALVRSMDRDELLRALGVAVEGLLRESHDAREVASRVEAQLRALASGSWSDR